MYGAPDGAPGGAPDEATKIRRLGVGCRAPTQPMGNRTITWNVVLLPDPASSGSPDEFQGPQTRAMVIHLLPELTSLSTTCDCHHEIWGKDMSFMKVKGDRKLLLRHTALVAGSLLLASCASIVEGTDQSITVNLSPENASCRVIREGTQVASISKNNRFLNLSKSRHDLIIECSAVGHHDETVSIESSASGWGVVGCFLIDLCITDFATGALNKYPKSINISLAPTNFSSKESREHWYVSARQTMETRWNKIISRKTAECDGTEQGSACRTDLANTRNKKMDALRKLEARHANTTTVNTTTPANKPGTIRARLAELQSLYDSGAITKAEYAAKRKDVLSEF